MALLTRDQVKQVVLDSLKAVGDLPANPEQSTFQDFNTMQKHVFLSNLKSKLNSLPYIMNDGTLTHTAYYDVNLNPDSTDSWPAVKDCIDWVFNNQFVCYLS